MFVKLRKGVRKPRKTDMEVVKSGGEVRRVHIIYFLSCMGHTDHPHLIRVHHLARNGVYLRGEFNYTSF